MANTKSAQKQPDNSVHLELLEHRVAQAEEKGFRRGVGSTIEFLEFMHRRFKEKKEDKKKELKSILGACREYLTSSEKIEVKEIRYKTLGKETDCESVVLIDKKDFNDKEKRKSLIEKGYFLSDVLKEKFKIGVEFSLVPFSDSLNYDLLKSDFPQQSA